MAIHAQFHLQFYMPRTCNFAKWHKITFVGLTISFQIKKYVSKSEHSSQSYRPFKKGSQEKKEKKSVFQSNFT